MQLPVIMSELVYLSQPSRLGGAGSEEYRHHVIEEVTSTGLHVVHPFEALPYERFEGNPDVGRELSIHYCCRLIDACDGGIALTGISSGTLTETEYLFTHFPLRSLHIFTELDPSWEQEFDRYGQDPKFEAVVGKIAGILAARSNLGNSF